MGSGECTQACGKDWHVLLEGGALRRRRVGHSRGMGWTELTRQHRCSFNKRQEDFVDLNSYNDYLEEFEDLSGSPRSPRLSGSSLLTLASRSVQPDQQPGHRGDGAEDQAVRIGKPRAHRGEPDPRRARGRARQDARGGAAAPGRGSAAEVRAARRGRPSGETDRASRRARRPRKSLAV